MNFLKTLGGFVNGSTTVGGLPYSISLPECQNSTCDVATEDCTSFIPLAPMQELHELANYELYAGHHKSNTSQQVSIFKSKPHAPIELIQNALRRIKTLRHPNILAYLDGAEVPGSGKGPHTESTSVVWIVTEPVMPLTQYLCALRKQYGSSSEEFIMSVSWGLRSILLALKFLNMDCKVLHGEIMPQSVFVTTGGDWKLGGFQLAGEFSSEWPASVFKTYEHSADPNFKSPEWARREWNVIASKPVSAIDIYSFACLVYFVFNDDKTLRMGGGDPVSNIPHAIRTQYRKALDTNHPERRPSPDKFEASSFFDSPFIKRMDFLEHLAVKSSDEKAQFYKDLCAHLNKLPAAFGMYKVLPALQGVIDFGAATSAKNSPMKLDPSASHMLPAMVQIGSLLPLEQYKIRVLPSIVKMFSSHDRAVRVQLLQMMEKFAIHFDAKLVNSPAIFDNICSGFADTSPIVRELTVKSILCIVDKLTDSNLNNKVMRHFAKLQTDPEPAIRTNTTICLGRIASKLNEGTRAKLLLTAFIRAMRDPFPHARLAGIKSLTACEIYLPSEALANHVIPAMAPLLLDVSGSVREQAALSFTAITAKVTAAAAEMKLRDEEKIREEKLKMQQQYSGELKSKFQSASNDVSTHEDDGYKFEENVVRSYPDADSDSSPIASASMALCDLTIQSEDAYADELAWGEDEDLYLANMDIASGGSKCTSANQRHGLLKTNRVLENDLRDDDAWGSDAWKDLGDEDGTQVKVSSSIQKTAQRARKSTSRLKKEAAKKQTDVDGWDDWNF